MILHGALYVTPFKSTRIARACVGVLVLKLRAEKHPKLATPCVNGNCELVKLGARLVSAFILSAFH